MPTMPRYKVKDTHDPCIVWYSYTAGDRIEILNRSKGKSRATVNRTEVHRVIKANRKKHQTIRVYMTTDDGKRVWRVAKNIRHVTEDDDDTVYSNDSSTMVDLTDKDNPINQKGYKYTAPSE